MISEGAENKRLTEGAADKKSACPKRLVSLEGAAVYLNVSRWTVQRYVEARGLPRVVIGRTVKFDLRDLDAFIEARKERSR